MEKLGSLLKGEGSKSRASKNGPRLAWLVQ